MTAIFSTQVAPLFKLATKLDHSERKYLLECSLSYAKTRNRTLTWQVVREIEEKTIEDREKRIMSGFLFALEEEHQKALKEGIKKGRKEGREEGKEEGLEKGRREIALNLIKMQMGASQIAAITGLSQAQIRRPKKSKS